ncbi:unnamed protein product [Natator depressus]
MLVLHTFHFLTLVSFPDTKLRDFLPPVEGEEPQWASLYSTLVLQPAGDIGWRLLHGAMSTGVYLAKFTPIPDACPFFSMRETLAHAYLESDRFQPLFQNLLGALFPTPLHIFTPCPWPHKVAVGAVWGSPLGVPRWIPSSEPVTSTPCPAIP